MENKEIRQSGMFGRKHSEATKEKMRIARARQKPYKWTDEQKAKKSELSKSRKFYDNLKGGMKGKHHSKETRDKISASRKGIKFSEEHIKNISLSHKGQIPSNIEQLISYGKSIKGKKRDRCVGLKVSNTLKEYWSRMPENIREERVKVFILAGQNNAPNTKDTSIELRVQDFLKQLNIPFEKHKFMPIKHRYLCDIFVPLFNLVLECDGDFWHNYPFGTEVDLLRNEELSSLGYKVLRLWERDIKVMDLKSFKELLNRFLEAYK